MNKYLTTLISTCVLLLSTKSSLAADSFSEAFSAGKTNLSFRYRYEFVDQNAFDRDANASTLRTRLNFKTDTYKGLGFFIEVDNVTEIFGDNYNSGAGTSPNRTRFPVVADPTGTELNQAWFNYQFSEHALKLGRMRIILDDQRFVGGVGWRQNEQTYDGANFNFKIGSSQLKFYYIDRVNRIFGGDVPVGDHDNETYLLNWSNTWNDRHRLVVYYYGIENEDAAAFSTQTTGLSFDTHWQLGNNKATLDLDYATQSDAANNPVDFDADYWKVEGGLKFERFNLVLGQEVLTGSNTQGGAAFRTPLATLHAFNGWADQFLGTPGTGIEDTFIGINGAHNQFKWYLRYHDYAAESISLDYGTEWNASLAMKISKKTSALLKYAQYESDGFGTDTNKVWFMLTINL